MKMENVRVAAVQFEPVKTDKEANFETIKRLTEQAVEQGAEIVCFHEQSIVGYGLWADPADKEQPNEVDGIWSPLWNSLGTDPFPLAEPVPGGPFVEKVGALAKEHKIVIMAGTHELGEDNSVYNTYFSMGPEGFIGKYSKCHCVPGAEEAYFKHGSAFPVFNAGKVNYGSLICYDNHFPEAHRILSLKGAHLIVMPHVTAGRAWWPDPEHTLEEAQEQARQWVLKWLRARAFDNSVYCMFVNQASESGEGCLGCSMILDPEGRVIARTEKTGEDMAVADLDADFFYRVRRRSHDYMSHRRPELYWELSEIE
jgi:predicted amidohydrolase